MATFEEQVKALDFRGIILSLIIAAMAFVVGLFWRDAISETIKLLTPKGEGLLYAYIAAITATVIVVILAYILIRAQNVKIEKLVKKINGKSEKEEVKAIVVKKQVKTKQPKKKK